MKGSDWTISRKGHTYDFNPLSFLGAIQLLLPLLDAIKIIETCSLLQNFIVLVFACQQSFLVSWL